jgi:hypothetical protein
MVEKPKTSFEEFAMKMAEGYLAQKERDALQVPLTSKPPAELRHWYKDLEPEIRDLALTTMAIYLRLRKHNADPKILEGVGGTFNLMTCNKITIGDAIHSTHINVFKKYLPEVKIDWLPEEKEEA